jgi:hypothetical protein
MFIMVEETGVPRIVLCNIMLNESWMKIMICMPENLHTKKKHIQILTFGQQKNARYKKQQS